MGRPIGRRHQDDVRRKIQASQLINVLQNHALKADSVEITSSRLKAIEILLRKSIPDLSAVTVGNEEGEEFKVAQRVELVALSDNGTD